MSASYIPRWGHSRRNWESAEKSDWDKDFDQLLDQAAPILPPKPPQPQPEPRPVPAPAVLFRNLREKLESLG